LQSTCFKLLVPNKSKTVILPLAFVHFKHMQRRNSQFTAHTSQKQQERAQRWILSTRLRLGQLNFQNQQTPVVLAVRTPFRVFMHQNTQMLCFLKKTDTCPKTGDA